MWPQNKRNSPRSSARSAAVCGAPAAGAGARPPALAVRAQPFQPSPVFPALCFGLRWQAKRDTALERRNHSVHVTPVKAPSPLRSAGALQDAPFPLYSTGMKLQQGPIWISFGASRVLAANFRQSHAATTELRASTSAVASLSLISGSAATNPSNSGFSSFSFSSEGLSRFAALDSHSSAGIAGDGRGLRTLTRKKNFLSGDQFKPERMSSGKSRFSDSTSKLIFPGGTARLMSTQ